MSSSQAHDTPLELLKRWLRTSCGCEHIVTEMARPRRYFGLEWKDEDGRDVLGPDGKPQRPWPSVDLYGFRNFAHDAVTIDVKVTKPDSDAQLHKPYVIDRRLNVGVMQYIASPAPLAVTVPDGYGLIRFDDTQAWEEYAPIPVKPWNRNWEAETCYTEMARNAAKIDQEGRATDRGVHKERGQAKRLQDALKGVSSISVADAMKLLDVTRSPLERVVNRCPALAWSEQWGKREIVLAGKEAGVSP